MDENKRLKIIAEDDQLDATLKVMSNTDIAFDDRKAMLDNELGCFGTLTFETYSNALQNLKRADWEK